jgi:hypothetical protein
MVPSSSPKFEARNPKFETNPNDQKSEIQNEPFCLFLELLFIFVSVFVFDFDIRISDLMTFAPLREIIPSSVAALCRAGILVAGSES